MFSAYESCKPSVFRDILSLDRIKGFITLYTETPELSAQNEKMAYEAMIESLLQSLLSSTRDVCEIIRLSCLLWPRFIEPLAKETDSSIPVSGVNRSLLDRESRPYISALLKTCLFQPHAELPSRKTSDSSLKNSLTLESFMTTQTKFLLIASFLCQHNAEKLDPYLYTARQKGKRRQKNKNALPDDEENNSTGTSRPFPSERLLSIFSSIYGQYGCCSDTASVGSILLFKSLADLQSLGYLVDSGSVSSNNDKSFFVSKKFRCTLSKELADQISTSVNFPLARYLGV
mmetsp:Transcript_26305/g.39124  ORF Transcript_26305/g.39124 Transcript_26305/m.39124 type:complete len:288 (-) Transcript_26305:3728-4591(-)